MPVRSFGGGHTFIDDTTRFTSVYIIKRKSEKFPKQEGILKETTAPYSPQFNGVVEQAKRTIEERARCMLDDACLSNRFWAEAVTSAVYLKNISPTKALSNRISTRRDMGGSLL